MEIPSGTREKISIDKYVGVGNFKVLAVNPDKAELSELLGKEFDDEPEYVKTKADGKQMVIVKFWTEEEETKQKFSIDFILTEDLAFSSDKANPKALYINQVGDTQYVDDEKNLFESFKNFTKIVDWKSASGQISKKYIAGSKPNEIEYLGEKEYRQAYAGEKELYAFIQNWLSEVELSEPGIKLLVDFDKLMEGDVSELQGLVGSKYTGTVVAAAIVETDKDDKDKHYQKVSKKGFLPGESFKYFKLGNFPKRMAKRWTEFQAGINRETKSHSLELIHKYDPETDLNNSGSTMNPSDSSY